MNQTNPQVAATAAPPIAEVQARIQGRSFTGDRPLLDVSQAVPSYPPAASLRAHLAELVTQPDTSLYTGISGLPDLRRELASRISQDYQGTVDADQVCITAGCNQAFCVAVSALAQAGDEVIMPVPHYFNYQMWLESSGIRPVALPTSEHLGLVPDPTLAEPLITDRTRAIVLVSPNNPTGAVYPPATISAFRDLAAHHGIALVVDETYRDFRADTGPPHDLFSVPGWDDTLVHLYSFSKVYSLTGYRVGAVVCSPRLLAQIEKLMDCVAICAPRIGQRAALFGLRSAGAWKEQKRQLMVQRLAAMKAAFDHPDLRYELVSSGAYFGYVRHPFEAETALSVVHRLIDQHHLLCLPGSAFGPGQERYLRFAFANLEATELPGLVQTLLQSQNPL